MLTVAVSEPSSLDSCSMYAPASPTFTAEIMRVARSAVFSTWYRSSPLGRVWPERIHWMDGVGSPEKTPDTVRGFPGSPLTFCGRALIFGGVPVNTEKTTSVKSSWNHHYNTWLQDSHINKPHLSVIRVLFEMNQVDTTPQCSFGKDTRHNAMWNSCDIIFNVM